MSTRHRLLAASVLMAVGVAPFVAMLGWLVGTSGNRGDAALSAAFIAMAGYVIAYGVALAIAFPASLCSFSLANTTGFHSRWASGLRRCVLLVMLSPFALCAVIAFGVSSR